MERKVNKPFGLGNAAWIADHSWMTGDEATDWDGPDPTNRSVGPDPATGCGAGMLGSSDPSTGGEIGETTGKDG